MNYKAKRMIKHSRFKKFVNSLTKEEYNNTLKNIDKLIEENNAI